MKSHYKCNGGIPGTLFCWTYQHILSTNTSSSAITKSSPFLHPPGNWTFPPCHLAWRTPSTGVSTKSVPVSVRRIWTISWQMPAVGNVYSSSFPPNLYPHSSITWQDHPYGSRMHWPRWHRLPPLVRSTTHWLDGYRRHQGTWWRRKPVLVLCDRSEVENGRAKSAGTDFYHAELIIKWPPETLVFYTPHIIIIINLLPPR